MSVQVVPLPTISDLHIFVRNTLCERDRLDAGVTPFFAAPIQRGGRTCGYLFHIEGPRLMKNSALWTEDDQRILFYDSMGTRLHEIRLSDAPEIVEQPKRAA
jgi:hypothetical protein